MTRDLDVVVVGSGRVGLLTTRLLAERGHDVTVVERNPERVEAVLDAYVATVIEGDATRPSVLEQAGIERADVVLAMADTAATNLAVCLAAKRIDPTVRTVLRTVDEETDEYEGYVDAAVFPERAGARMAINVVEGGVRSFEGAPGDLELIEFSVAEDAPVAGRSLADVSLPRGALVVSDAEGDRIAGSETRLAPGGSYIVAVEPAVVDEVRQLFRG